MKPGVVSVIISLVILSGCAQVLCVVQTVNVQIPLSEDEVISGLKEALTT